MKLLKNLFIKSSNTLSELDEHQQEQLNLLQKRISHTFKDKKLLQMALTHTSYVRSKNNNGNAPCEYERMEFFGDAVLELITVEHLYTFFPQKSEGYLSKLKSQIVSENYLACKAKLINLGECIILGEDEYRNRGYEKKSILSNMMESLICAIYLDGGLGKARKFIKANILDGFQEEVACDIHTNYKSILQEYSQSKYQRVPHYQVVSEEGPDHHKLFTIVVSVMDEEVGIGSGFSKKEAEQNAAKEGCLKLDL
ncbi:MAG: ribonuclease III [Candidatus Cloacimonas sp.]|nr:ribonuclease III [Candidatus Cloacimonadota bacterium]